MSWHLFTAAYNTAYYPINFSNVSWNFPKGNTYDSRQHLLARGYETAKITYRELASLTKPRNVRHAKYSRFTGYTKVTYIHTRTSSNGTMVWYNYHQIRSSICGIYLHIHNKIALGWWSMTCSATLSWITKSPVINWLRSFYIYIIVLLLSIIRNERDIIWRYHF